MSRKVFGKIENWNELRKKGKGRFLLATSIMPIVIGFSVFMAVAFLRSKVTGMPFGLYILQKGLIVAALLSIPSFIYGNGIWMTNERLQAKNAEQESDQNT